ncbi:MAG TPA: recombinase family protein [Azospirillaceae bacterium]|nr:recombinase family protein [Azospirillaceae bacterium]
MADIAAVYIRVSTADQQYGQSLEIQRDDCLRHAAAAKFDIPGDLIFTDVMSGKNPDRPGLKALMTAAGEKRFSRLYIWALDRLGRSLKDSVNAVVGLRESGITVMSIKDGDLTSPVILGVLAGLAEQEHGRIRERTLPPKQNKRDQGLWVNGAAPFGYAIASDKSLVVCPDEAVIVRRIFDAALSGLGRIQIVNMLLRDKVLPPEVQVTMPDGRVRRVRVGHHGGWERFQKWLREIGGTVTTISEWQSSTISKILSNPAACGRGTDSKDRPIKLKCDRPIVSTSEFDAVQKALKSRYRAGKAADSSRWLLTGILTCGNCGASYRHHASGTGQHYYACNGRKSGKSCKSPGIPVRVAEGSVVQTVRRHLRAALPRPEFFVEFVSDQARKSIADLERLERQARDARDAAREEWEKAQRVLLRLVGDDDQLPEEALSLQRTAVADAHRHHSELEVQHQKASTNLTYAQAGLRAAAIDAEKVGRRMFDALDLVAGHGEDEQHLTDVHHVLKALVSSALVSADKTINVELDTSVDKLGKLLSTMSVAKVGEVTDEAALVG